MNNSGEPSIWAIVAMADNRVIGKNNQLPWHLPADLKHFKTITTGNAILMGRKTFESIGKPLPNRLNLILSRNGNYSAPGCQVVTSLEEAKKLASAEHKEIIFIIGGAEIYRQLLPQVERLYVTLIHQSFDGDAFFPELNMADWKEIEREDFSATAEQPLAYSFVTLEK